jgi:hypothetical protein
MAACAETDLLCRVLFPALRNPPFCFKERMSQNRIALVRVKFAERYGGIVCPTALTLSYKRRDHRSVINLARLDLAEELLQGLALLLGDDLVSRSTFQG